MMQIRPLMPMTPTNSSRNNVNFGHKEGVIDCLRGCFLASLDKAIKADSGDYFCNGLQVGLARALAVNDELGTVLAGRDLPNRFLTMPDVEHSSKDLLIAAANGLNEELGLQIKTQENIHGISQKNALACLNDFINKLIQKFQAKE